jgi:hypothetical protein
VGISVGIVKTFLLLDGECVTICRNNAEWLGNDCDGEIYEQIDSV